MTVWYRGGYKNVAIIFQYMLIHIFFNVEVHPYGHVRTIVRKILSSIKM